jgi:hypothetical protein
VSLTLITPSTGEGLVSYEDGAETKGGKEAMTMTSALSAARSAFPVRGRALILRDSPNALAVVTSVVVH